MAAAAFVLLFFCNLLLVNSEINPENASNKVATHKTDIQTVLDYLNATPVKIYRYKDATLLNAHTKADITELTLDVSVDCINNYPDLPCTDKILLCNAFVRKNPDGSSQVLSDVNCKPKPEIIIEEPPYLPPTKPTEAEINETKSIALSNEAVSSEVGEHFVAVRKETAPCLGCPFDLNPNAEGVDGLVKLALRHIETESTNRQALVRIIKLQQQVVAGVKYILLAEIAPTICTKDSNLEQESCPLDSNANKTVCQITYLHKPWINQSKHIIANNCTTSQEYVLEQTGRDDINNEIDVNTDRTKFTPNFDQIAQSGAADEMSPPRLADLESQIIVESEAVTNQPKQAAQATSDAVAVVTQPLEDKPTLLNTEETSSYAEPSTETTFQADTQPTFVDDFVAAFYGSVDSGNFPDELATDSAVKAEDATTQSSKRRKRAIRQLEKVSPEEKGLVKNLAEFAATELDNIDDDNNRRVVLQILGAKKMVGDDGVYYRLIMRMGISHCLEDKVPTPYDNCREKLFENYTKICKVQVYVNDDFHSPRVVKSQCQNIKKDKNDSNRTNYSRFRREVLKGGLKQIDKNSDSVQQLLREGITHLNLQSTNNNKYKPVEVISATSQVVAGLITRIKAKISPSNCLNTDNKDLDECDVVADAPSKICNVKVWEKPWLNFKQTTITCEGDDNVYKFETNGGKRSKRGIPGGQFDVPSDDEYVTKYLESSLSHLDSESAHAHKLKVHEIISVTKQIVAGHIYRIKAKIVQSECNKTEDTDRSSCGQLEGAEPTICDFNIYERLWIKDSRETNITCENDQKQHFFKAKRSVTDDLNAHFVMFNDFIGKHNKSYTKKEYKYRFKVFSDNMDYVKLLNAHEQGTAVYGVTKFADLTRLEFSKSLGLRTDLRNENEAPFAHARIPDVKLPTEFDWRSKGAVTEVKNQEQCGSCWAFSVTGNVEGQYAIKHGKLLEFSEQELVDCDTEDQGCNGGLMDTAYRVIEKIGGLETENDYPYDAEDEKCHFNRSLARVQLSGALNISHDETDMAKWLVANGPISIAINANAMQFYMGGVSHPFKFLCSPNNLDHGVLIVGYGVHKYPLFKKNLPYWIVKNSWGTSWGEQGYYRVYRGDGTCGLNQTPSSAIVA